RPRGTGGRSREVEVVLETDREPGAVADRGHRVQHARHERGPVGRVVADGEQLARVAQEDLLVRGETALRQRVHPYAVDRRAAGTVERGGGGVGARAPPGGTTGRGDRARGVHGRPARGVHLVRVVQL